MGLWSGQSEVSEKYWPVRKASGWRRLLAGGQQAGRVSLVVSCAARTRWFLVIPLRKYDFMFSVSSLERNADSDKALEGFALLGTVREICKFAFRDSTVTHV